MRQWITKQPEVAVKNVSCPRMIPGNVSPMNTASSVAKRPGVSHASASPRRDALCSFIRNHLSPICQT